MNVVTNSAHYLAIADAIRSKTDTTNLIYPSQMANLISQISGNDYTLINVVTSSTSSTGATITIRTYKVDAANKKVITDSRNHVYTNSPLTFGGLTISYDHSSHFWHLNAAQDYIYYNGQQYGSGASISKWTYNEYVNLWMYG